MLWAQERQCQKCKKTYVWYPGQGEGEIERDLCPECRKGVGEQEGQE